MSPDLVLLGNLIVDDIVFADGTTRMAQPGGAILYAALGAQLWGTRVGVCAPRGTDYPPGPLEALAACGVDLGGLRALARPGLRTWLLYEPEGRRVVHRLGSPSHAAASPAPGDLPGAWSGARACHVAPIPLACQAPLVQALARQPRTLVSIDPHDPITEDSLARWRETLALVDMLFVSEEELVLADARLEARLARLAGGRLRFVALKCGARGGQLYDVRGDRVRAWPARASRVVDPTGAGDAFAAGFLSAVLAGVDTGTTWDAAPLPEAVVAAALAQGVVSASFALEGWGPDGLLAATRAVARERLEAWFGAREAA